MKKPTRQALLTGVALISFAFLLFYIRQVWTAIRMLLAILTPVLVGAAIAFVLNVPVRFFEGHMPAFMNKNSITKKLKRPLAFFIVAVLLAAVVTGVVAVLVPKLAETAQSLWNGLPGAIDKAAKWLATKGVDVSSLLVTNTQWAEMSGEELRSKALSIARMLLSGIVTSGSIIGAVYANVLGIFFTVMFSLYFLFGKERLLRQFRQLLYIALPEDRADAVMRVGRMTNKTYASFITGQSLEALILGVLFFIAMTCFGMHYALLISVIIAVTALIPVVGAWIGCIGGAFLILTVEPVQALWFVLMFVIIQQLEGNLIYPRVMGNAIGLPSVWVLLAVVVGEGLLGIVGMLLFIPLASVAYTLLRERTQKEIARRGVPPEKLA